jgi:hypothetical protein
LSTKHQAAVLGSKRKRVTGLSDPTTSLTTEFFDSIDPLLTLAGLNFRSAASPDLISPMRYAAPSWLG